MCVCTCVFRKSFVLFLRSLQSWANWTLFPYFFVWESSWNKEVGLWSQGFVLQQRRSKLDNSRGMSLWSWMLTDTGWHWEHPWLSLVIPDWQTWCLQYWPKLRRGSPEPETRISPTLPQPKPPLLPSARALGWPGLAWCSQCSACTIAVTFAFRVLTWRKGWREGQSRTWCPAQCLWELVAFQRKFLLLLWSFSFLFVGGDWDGAQEFTCARCV